MGKRGGGAGWCWVVTAGGERGAERREEERREAVDI